MGLFDLFRKGRRSADAGKPKAKQFKLPREQIQRLVPNMGGCIASDMITVEGNSVGYMYREEPRNDVDSGWVFLSGLEPQEYMDNPSNHGVYEVNTICNYDKSIIPYLDAAPGTAFIRDPATGSFRKESLARPGEPLDDSAVEARRQDARQAGLNPDFPVVEGRYRLTKRWSVLLPAKLNRRMEHGDLCLWRPGFTIWASAFGNDKRVGKLERLTGLRGEMAKEAFDVTTGDRGSLLLLSYRLTEESGDQRRAALYCLAVADDGHLQLGVYFDKEEDFALAQGILASVEWTEQT